MKSNEIKRLQQLAGIKPKSLKERMDKAQSWFRQYILDAKIMGHETLSSNENSIRQNGLKTKRGRVYFHLGKSDPSRETSKLGGEPNELIDVVVETKKYVNRILIDDELAAGDEKDMEQLRKEYPDEIDNYTVEELDILFTSEIIGEVTWVYIIGSIPPEDCRIIKY